MKEYKDIRDDQIRIIGEQDKKAPWSRNLWFVTLSILGIVIIGVFTYLFLLKKDEDIKLTKSPLCWSLHSSGERTTVI